MLGAVELKTDKERTNSSNDKMISISKIESAVATQKIYYDHFNFIYQNLKFAALL